MGDRYGRSDINEISIGLSIWNMCYRFGMWYIDMVIYHIDMVILDIDMGDEANDVGDDRIDTVISHIDMGYLVTLSRRRRVRGGTTSSRRHQARLNTKSNVILECNAGTDVLPAEE